MPPGTSQQPTMIQSQSVTAPAHNSGRLKYADPRDLPSFPSTGLRPDGAAASAAASLGWSNQKPIELWKPDKTSSASAAAALAKNYKMAPSWEPTSNSAGQQAALLAVGSANAANKSSIQRKSHEGWGSSAANQAFNANRSNSIRQVHQTTSNSSLQGQKSLAAAKGAMATTRRRAQSTPTAPPGRDPLHPGASTRPDALSGATLAHKASLRSKPSTESAGAVPITTMTRNMFTSHPPVKPEVDERKTNEQLHATAVAMARKMYTQQQKMIDQAKDNQGQDSDVAQPKPYINLQDAAYKQAQERLAKLEEEHQKNRDLQGYYGNSPSSRRRFMLTSKLRRRSSSDGDLDDRQQSEKIRQQMSLFSNKLSEVDEKKRAEDRNILLAAAQRNVKARLQGMDEKVYHETGMVNPTLMNEWELKAHQVATASHDARNENKGKVDIGGGKFMDPHEVNTIAAKRVKPVLDDINEKAEVERERLATLKLEEEAKKAEQEKQKAREREIKEITKKLKEQEKQEYKTKKAEEKTSRAEEKRHAKEEKRRSRGDSVVTGEEGTDDHASARSAEAGGAPVTVTEPTERPTTMRLDTDTSNTDNQRKMSDSGMSPTSKVKGWIRNRFSRGKSLGEKDRETHGDKRRSFIGGAALRGSDLNHSTTSLDNRPSSMRDVAFAGRSAEAETSDAERKDSRGVSPVSTLEDLTTDRTRGLAITPPPAIEDPAVRETPSPSRDSRFKEMMDQ